MFGGILLGGAAESAAPSAEDVRGWMDQLANEATTGSDSALVEQIECLERLKSAAAARQARLTATFADSQRAAQRIAGMRPDEVSRGIGAQIALARHDSPHSGNRHLGVAEALVHEMPKTFAALRAGDTSEYRASLLVRESACLAKEHRAALDAELGPQLVGMGNTRVERESRKIAYRLDPDATLRRIRGAEADRNVSIRPAPDVMARLTGFLPAAQGVAAYASLRTHADRLKAQGDSRSRGQIMADAFAERLTGQAHAGVGDAEIMLVIPEQTLTAAPTESATCASWDRAGQAGKPADLVDEPARLDNYGPVPAWWARRLVHDSPGRIWLRRCFTRDARLVALESTRRLFPDGLRRALIVRDDTCRTPWCNAPIRHIDHIVPVAAGGATNIDNGQGLCAACNYTKEVPGWTTGTDAAANVHTVRITTPTGHTYQSQAPPLPDTERRSTGVAKSAYGHAGLHAAS